MIDKLLHILTEIDSSNSQDIQNALNYSKEVGLIKATESAKLPFHINVISSAAIGRLKETAHSMILTDLLHKDKIRDLFLAYFFKDKIDPKNFTEIYRPDTKRIDVSLRGKDFFLIVENKVNNADEQQGQIYRYVEIANKEYKYDYSQILVLYLNSDNYEAPSKWSLTKDGEGVDNIIQKGKLPPENLIVKTYKYDILEWLKIVRDSFTGDAEYYIDSALYQYVDYIENKFQISKRHNNMNNKINNLLTESLNLNSDNQAENMRRVDEAIKDAESLCSYLRECKIRIFQQILKDCYNELNVSGLKLSDRHLYKEFRYNEKDFTISLYINGDNTKLWWTIENKKGNTTTEDIEYFNSLLKDSNLISKHAKDDRVNPIWNYTSPENAISRYRELLNIVKMKGLL